MDTLSSFYLTKNAVNELLGKIDAAIARGRIKQPGLLRVSMDVEAVSAIEWFCRCSSDVRFYFSSRDQGNEVAGCGVAHKICDDTHEDAASALKAINENLANQPDEIRYYGGICFDAEQTRQADDDFGKFSFFVPELELRRDSRTTTLAFTTVTGPRQSAEQVRRQLQQALRQLRQDWTSPSQWSADRQDRWTMISQTDVPDASVWARNVTAAIEAMRSQNIGKVVLSRKAEIIMSEPVEPGELLRRIRSDDGRTYDFCFQFADTAFLGSSPECLYRRRGRVIYTEALAGTMPVGHDEAETRGFRAKLRESAKEAEEHEYVFEDLQRELERICSESRVVSERDVLTLSHVQHFCSRFEGRLRDGVTAAEIIEALHPTAAVNGSPKDAALELIRNIEQHSRQWYAGPIGWLGLDEDEFAVGIRSCVVAGDRVRLFAGAGIVRASDPDAEWMETEAKMRQFLEALE